MPEDVTRVYDPTWWLVDLDLMYEWYILRVFVGCEDEFNQAVLSWSCIRFLYLICILLSGVEAPILCGCRVLSGVGASY